MDRSGKTWRRDLVLVLALLAVAGILLLVTSGREKGGDVRVEVDGELEGIYPLDENGTFTLNGGTNILVIEDGCAYMKDADCPDRLCVRQGRISRRGETITCLPNRLTVTVERKPERDDVEIVI